MEARVSMATVVVSGFTDAVAKMAHTAFNRGDWVEAERLAAEVRTARPDKPLGYVIGAKACFWMSRHAEAEALFREALARMPRDNWVYQDWLWMHQ